MLQREAEFRRWLVYCIRSMLHPVAGTSCVSPFWYTPHRGLGCLPGTWGQLHQFHVAGIAAWFTDAFMFGNYALMSVADPVRKSGRLRMLTGV